MGWGQAASDVSITLNGRDQIDQNVSSSTMLCEGSLDTDLPRWFPKLGSFI